MPRTIPTRSLSCALSIALLANCTPHVVRVPTVVTVERPPCHRADDEPPTTEAEPMTAPWVAAYRELVAYAWRVHVQCSPPRAVGGSDADGR